MQLTMFHHRCVHNSNLFVVTWRAYLRMLKQVSLREMWCWLWGPTECAAAKSPDHMYQNRMYSMYLSGKTPHRSTSEREIWLQHASATLTAFLVNRRSESLDSTEFGCCALKKQRNTIRPHVPAWIPPNHVLRPDQVVTV